MTETIHETAEVPESLAGQRLDQVAAQLFNQFSRSRLQGWIKNGQLVVNGETSSTRNKVFGGELLELEAELEAQVEWVPQAIDLDIIYEDESILVVNKPTGLVVHPGSGNSSGTLLNALLHHDEGLANVPRAGIVHRLDKDTTGLMVVAKTLEAHADLVAQLQERTVSREYEAIAQGVMTGGGRVDANIARHPTARTKMAVSLFGGKESITHYRVLKRFSGHTHIRLKLETGRTHQIRVHMAHIGYPLMGDGTYGGRFKIPKGMDRDLIEELRAFPRQALHAAQLGLNHPATGEYMEWAVPLPSDMNEMLKKLRHQARPQ